jgi:hypothetical protein
MSLQKCSDRLSTGPSIIDDASKLVTTCQACQIFLPSNQAPSQPSQVIIPSWPLQRWGIDIVGPLTTAQGNYKYAVVAVEYFTVDRGEASSQYSSIRAQKVRLAKYNMLFRSA